MAYMNSNAINEPVFVEYIHLYRDKTNRNLNISISKSLRNGLNEEQYLQGKEMYRVLNVCTAQAGDFLHTI